MANKSKYISETAVLRSRFYELLPGKESLIKIINEAEVSEQVYNSNAIENSTLSLEETEKILLQIDLDRFVNEREIYEAKNLSRVTNYIENKSKESELNVKMILLLHKMLIGNIDENIAGRFRKDDEWVRVGSHIGASPKEVESLIDSALLDYKADIEINIITRVSRLHLAFESIHPFCDGNGRIGRVLNNYILMREGYVPINITFTDRAKYYDAFKEYDKNGESKLMEEIIGRALLNSYHKRLAYLEGKKIITLSEYVKLNKISHSNMLNKAKRQTVPAFTEKGVWKIGV